MSMTENNPAIQEAQNSRDKLMTNYFLHLCIPLFIRVSEALTMTLTFCYTMYIMMIKLKKHGLLDKDFLQGLSLFILPIVMWIGDMMF